jgi:hypothetical protein
VHTGRFGAYPVPGPYQRYKTQATSFGKKKPYAQVMTLPIIPTIKALYANAETSTLLRQRDTYLKQALWDFSKINEILLLHFQQMVLNLL